MSDILKTRAVERPLPRDGENPCPVLDVEQAQALRASLEANGFLPGWPVVRSAGPACEGEIIDGFHRTEFCKELGIEPTVVYQPCETETEFRILQIAANVQRRQMTTAQRAALANELERLYTERARERQRAGQSLTQPVVEGETSRRDREALAQAAKAVGVSVETARQYKAVAEKAPELLDKIDSGQKSIKQAYKEIRPAAQQTAIDETIDSEAEALAEIEAEYFTAQPDVEDVRNRLAGDFVRLVTETDMLIRKNALIPDEITDLRSRPHTFRGTVNRVREFLTLLEEAL